MPLAQLLITIIVLLLLIGHVSAQDQGAAADTMAKPMAPPLPEPVSGLTAIDNPNDDGGAIRLEWGLSPDDRTGGKVTEYAILRSTSADGPFEEVGDVTAGASRFIDGNAEDGQDYFYKVVPLTVEMESDELLDLLDNVLANAATTDPVQSSAQWFDLRRINVFVGVIALCIFILYYIRQAQSGKKLFIRKIAGLEAVDEAVGRATEMGKKIFYVPGTQDMNNVQTIAGVTILGRVAELAAQYETYLDVPVSRSLVMVTAREIVKEAYSKAGRPDAFQEDQVHYLTDDQFGYAAGIDGMVVREKPATIFFMGAFYAESLILAETGNSIGAIQIAGTGMPSQLPFFVAACDYTLIGEELFAASAYLSREPKLLGSLKGQDLGKAVILVALLLGILLETFGIWDFSQLFTVID
ncbi:hypothetical protein GF377_06435 [candidate division GN15 bacterium]|nr:hypothetical protein [candidate division GN15 bacterium]